MPEWGSAIFSDRCVAVRPRGPEDVNAFVQYAYALLSWYLALQRGAEPLQDDAAIGKAFEAQREYARQQRANAKTRGVLAAALGEEAADRYMREVMFHVEEVYEAPPPEGAGAEAVLRSGAKQCRVAAGPQAKIEVDGRTFWVPKGEWSLGEAAALAEPGVARTAKVLD